MAKLEVVVGGNAGSESKGRVVALLAQDRPDLIVARIGGPQAGHSAYGMLDDKKYAFCQVPIGALTNLDCRLVIAAGSEIDPTVLIEELDLLDQAGYHASDRLIIDGSATFMSPQYKQKEVETDMFSRLGSTMHGVGEARAARVMRTALTWKQALALPEYAHLAERFGKNTQDRTDLFMTSHLKNDYDLIIEGTQGYALGVHGPYYPKCTSQDGRAIDFMGSAGITPWGLPNVTVQTYVVVRTYPIRVAGNSGDLGVELTWEELASRTNGYIQPEQTTVTKRIRRIFEWNSELVRDAIAANGGSNACQLALAFFDYWFPELAGVSKATELKAEHWDKLAWVEAEAGMKPVLVGTGPNSTIDLRQLTV